MKSKGLREGHYCGEVITILSNRVDEGDYNAPGVNFKNKFWRLKRLNWHLTHHFFGA